MKFHVALAACTSLLATDARIAHDAGFGSAKHVLVIGIDGLGGMYLDGTLNDSPGNSTRPPLPNLDMMMREGQYTVRGRGQMPSVSGPNWGAMMTGMNPEESGIDSNSWTPSSASPSAPNSAGMPPINNIYPESLPEPEDPTVCFTGDGSNYRGTIAVTESGLPCQAWKSQSPNSHQFSSSDEHGLGEHNYCRNPDGEASPWCYNALSTSPRWELCTVPRCDNDVAVDNLPETMWKAAKLQDASIKTAVVYNWGWIEHFIDDAVDMSMQGNDSRIAQAMSSFVEDEQPELMFLAFDEVDGAGHSFGWGTPAYYSRVSNIDSLIGDVLDSLETAGIADETLVMVTSDHGGDNYGHGAFTQAEMYIPVIFYGAGVEPSSVPIKRFLSNRDLAPTAMYALGLEEGEWMTGRTAVEVFEQ